MSSVVRKFKPERPISLSRNNTKYKTEDEVIYAVEQLRSKDWLCVYSPDSIKPIFLSFNDEKLLGQFKKDCEILGIELIQPTIQSEDFEELIALEEKKITEVPGAEDKDTYEDSSGKVRKNKK